MHLELTCYHRWPVSPCLLAFLGDGCWQETGNRGVRKRLGVGCMAPSAGVAVCGHLQAAPCQCCPVPWEHSPLPLAMAPSSSPAHWSQSQCHSLQGWRRAMARPSPGRQASEGGLPYLQVLPPHVHCGEGQLHLLSSGILVPFIGDLNENQEDPSHDASSHQHEDPCGQESEPQLLAERPHPMENPPRCWRSCGGE